jgi:hypothetical protein
MNQYHIEFSGKIIERGFWIYTYKILHNNTTYFYVARTGDSSSPHASSPFSRMLSHFCKNLHSNSLTNNMKKAKISLKDSYYKLYAFGPLYPEQNNMSTHIPFRDLTASIEYLVARELLDKGYNVIGSHGMKNPIHNPEILTTVKEIIDALV